MPIAEARVRMLRVGFWKLNDVARVIRGKHVYEALKILSGVRKRIAPDVKKLLNSAIANAQNNHGMSVDNLWVSEATVGKDLIMRRADIRGRSRIGRIRKEFSQMRIVLVEGEE